DQDDGEASVKSHRNQSGLSITRYTFDADLSCIHGRIGFEVIQSASRAPAPRAQRTPVVGLAWLTFVNETDDSFGEAGAIVGLNAVGNDCRVTPTGGEKL